LLFYNGAAFRIQKDANQAHQTHNAVISRRSAHLFVMLDPHWRRSGAGHTNVVQPQDRYMNCTAIYAEVRENNRRVRELGREQGWKVVQNVAAGVGGLFIPILWFGMDWQGTAHKEAAALQARQEYLGALAIQKRCGRPA